MAATIKVSEALHDRLKKQAASGGLTLGAHLERLADAEDRRRRLASLGTAIASTSLADRRSHHSESREWEAAEDADLGERTQ